MKYSQMAFYHTARRTFAGLIEEGRRQLQALVRLQRHVIIAAFAQEVGGIRTACS